MNCILLVLFLSNIAINFGQNIDKNLTDSLINIMKAENLTEQENIVDSTNQSSVNYEVTSLDVDINSTSKRRNGVNISELLDSNEQEAIPIEITTARSNPIEMGKSSILTDNQHNSTLNDNLTTTPLKLDETSSSLSPDLSSRKTTTRKYTTVSHSDYNISTTLKLSENNSVQASTEHVKQPNKEIDTRTESNKATSVKPDIPNTSNGSDDIYNFTTKKSKLNPVPVKQHNGGRDKSKIYLTNPAPKKVISSSNAVVIWMVLMTALLFCSVIGFVVYKRIKAGWYRRHYERVDFLIDGMYEDL